MNYDLKFLISSEQIKRAKKLYLTRALKNSVTHGQRNMQATLSEICVADLFDGEWVANRSKDFDIIVNDITIDIKMRMKYSDMPPKPYWNAGVFDFNTRQNCQYYGWVSLRDNFDFFWLHGFLKPNDFYPNAFFSNKGDVDPNNPNADFRMPADAYNISLRNLQLLNSSRYGGNAPEITSIFDKIRKPL